MHVAAALAVHEQLLPEVRASIATLRSQGRAAFAELIKIGRTHLRTRRRCRSVRRSRVGPRSSATWAPRDRAATLPAVFELALGGTAVGTGLNTHRWASIVASPRSSPRRTGLPFVTAPNKFAALAGHDALVGLSTALRQLATALMKIANDVRWLASGRAVGSASSTIPENEPGSSIMPGKVNPTQAEALTMVCCQVMGNDVTSASRARRATSSSTCKPVIISAVLQSIRLLGDAVRSFRVHCAEGLEPNRARIARPRREFPDARDPPSPRRSATTRRRGSRSAPTPRARRCVLRPSRRGASTPRHSIGSCDRRRCSGRKRRRAPTRRPIDPRGVSRRVAGRGSRVADGGPTRRRAIRGSPAARGRSARPARCSRCAPRRARRRGAPAAASPP
jgi:hypothetical protein